MIWRFYCWVRRICPRCYITLPYHMPNCQGERK